MHRVTSRTADGEHWHCCDLLAADHGRALLDHVRPEIVLHLAWTVEHGAFWTDPRNVDWLHATSAFAQAAADIGVRRFVGAGTCWEYDWPEQADCVENGTPLVAHLAYDDAKARSRLALAALAAKQAISFCWARFFFLYGADEDPRRLLMSVARSIAIGEPARCTRGLAVRDFIDVVEAGRALAALTLSDVEGDVNIASGVGTSIADIVTRLAGLAGRPDLVVLGALADRPQEPPRIVADVTRLRSEVGFSPAAPDDASLRALLSAARRRDFGSAQ